MVDEVKNNLEPIDDSDLDLKDKFVGGGIPEKRTESEIPVGPEEERMPIPEQVIERKEGQVEKDETYSKILTKITAAVPAQDDKVGSDAELANAGVDAESKIRNLVNLAEVKGVVHAVKVARHMEDNYLLDEFHDRLMADELHDALLKKGLITQT